MSDVIRLLPDHVANQIAAGEVVQRPASIVKELLENAIDANASSIQIILKEAGRQLIQVIDNGTGMSVTDARMAFERHATSKILKTDDIFHIRTKGFRGEALASIAAVSQVELKTKLDSDELGTLFRIHGGQVKSQEPVVTATGTMISVSNIFYNVPARRNFLKSNTVEFRHIMDEFHRIALAHEDIEFSLIHNENEIFRLHKTHLAQRILNIFGKKLEGQLIPIAETTDMVKISGFVGKPPTAKKSRGEQFFFVNHRYVRSSFMHKAIQNAFENLISPGDHPSYFIFLELEPEKIDINIHPSKTEVKFVDEPGIYAQLRAATKHALGQFQVTPAIDFELPDWDVPSVQKHQEIRVPEISVDKNYNPFKTQTFRPPTKSSPGGSYEYYELEKPEQQNEEISLPKIDQTSWQCMQWQNAYIITEYAGDLILIDQHRAHQSILYQNFIKKSQENILSQQMLFPIEIPLSTNEIQLIEDSELQWISFGFDLKIQDENLIISAIPGDLQTEMIIPVFTEFLKVDLESENIEYNVLVAKYMAKAAAVKKGVPLSQEKLQNLLYQLFELEQFNYSPFGKVIYKSFTLQEIKKQLD